MQTRASRQLQQDKEQHRAERYERIGRQMPPKTLHKSVMGGEVRAAPKSEPYRDADLLEMAKDRPCLLMVPAICNHRTDTTVAAHSNLAEHGKGMTRKAEDVYSAWGCFACHSWLDQGKAAASAKEAVFMTAHARQVLAWRLIAMDASEPEKFRKAARRALERLNATPLEEV